MTEQVLQQKSLEQQLEEARKKYEKVCEKLDALNDEAFELEQEIFYLQNKLAKKNE